MTKCQFCHQGLNSTYIRTGSSGLFKKIGSYCNDCDLHYDLEQKLYIVNGKLYTVSNGQGFGDQLINYHKSTNILPNQPKIDNINKKPKQDYNFFIARPRFELGSKAPKASMLGHYTRHLKNTTGLPGIFILYVRMLLILRIYFIFKVEMYAINFSMGFSILLIIIFAFFLMSSHLFSSVRNETINLSSSVGLETCWTSPIFFK